MKKISACLIFVAYILTACTFNVEVLTPEPLTPTEVVVTPSTATLAVIESVSVTPTEVLLTPQFSNARFSVDVSTNIYQDIFPARTRRVYAVWDYQNMREGLSIRRDWYYNNVLWISREEPWDFSKYGANGTISDISVYDLDVGLESGEYRLELYIDMQPQPIGEVTWPMFTISSGGSETRVTSPNGQWIADADDPRKLLIRDTGKNVRQLFTGNEVANLTWLPDSQHILFIDRDRSQQVKGINVGVRDDLWIVEVISGESHLLYKNTALIGKLVLSPDVHYIASIDGSGFGDACFVDKKLIFFELSGDYRSVKSIKQDQFTGIPFINNDVVVYPVEMGVWKNEFKFDVMLAGTCNADQGLFGRYLLDLRSLKAEKTGQ